MSEFVDISLIECNREMSIEKDNDNSNNSLFTNRTGDTISLNIGDTISVDSAFINQKGCANLNSIEFKGESIGTGEFEYTSGTQIINSNLKYFMSNVSFWFKTLKKENKTLKDNECNIPVNYYKNSNGEGYTFLPRKYYGFEHNSANTTNFKTPQSEWNDTLKLRDTQGVGNTYTKGINSGICYYMPLSAEWDKYNSNDYHKVWEDSVEDGDGDYIWIKPKNDNSRFTLFIRDFFFKEWNDTTYTDTDGNTFDGEDWWSGNLVDYPKTSPVYRYNAINNKDPALSEYSKYQELLELSIEKGFNSPSSISQQITEQLQEEINNSPDTFTTTPSGYNTSIEITNAIETKLFKTYSCANLYNFSKTEYDDFKTTGGVRDTERAFNYWSSTNHIWVKRPEIFEKGRQCNNWKGWVDYYDDNETLISQWDIDIDTDEFGSANVIQNTLLRNTTTNGNYTDHIETSWLYNETNLKRLNDLFIAQGLYPELFENNNQQVEDNTIWNNVDDNGDSLTTATIDNSRFLHMNTRPFNNDVDIGYEELGSDGYEENTSIFSGRINTTYMSIPIFFKYDVNNKNKYINEPSTTNLSYGFSTKTIHTDGEGNLREYIVIHPELVNGLSPLLFHQRGGVNTYGDISANTTQIGWDYHYNSWGNVVMTGFTGIITQDYDGGSKVGSNGYYQHIPTELNDFFTSTYMGANNTALIYNNENNKFGFEYLHNPENITNSWNAGQTTIIGGDTTTTTSIPTITGAGGEVYKINKRPETFSYCPDLVPYPVNPEGQINPEWNKVEPTTLSILNKNIESWVIFDSHMGVNFNLGETCKLQEAELYKQKTIWKKSFLSKLGFTFEQFNPTIINALNNGQARVKYNNIGSIYNPTTNSQVISTDTKEMVVNKYGNAMYTTQLSMPYTFPYFYTASDTTTSNYGYYPALSIQTQSIILTAEELPEVVSIPYLTIRTDLINENKYLGGLDSGLKLPIISVINKINADKDYIQLADSSMSFTCKSPIKISSITTAITKPDGKLADTGKGNSIIYKIQKNDNTNNYNIIDQIIKKK